jgi:sulfotransferase
VPLQARHMVLVEYEALADAPHSTLRHLYTVLDEPYFEHDLDHVDYVADEFDLALGAPGLHTIRRKGKWVERQSVLPPELFQRFQHDAFWRRPEVNIRQVPIIRLD